MRWLWARLYHLKRTSGKHARERRRHQYAERCYQCGEVVTPTTKVAAHLVEQPLHPCGCGLGRAVLRTACKKCNRRERPFWRCCVAPADDVLYTRCC